MSVSYQFCVTRKSDSKIEKFGVEYNFGDLDPGKEVARVLVSQKYKQANTTNVHVEDYEAKNCGAIREESNVTMTGQQVQQLGAALAAGDPVGAAVIGIEVGAGITARSLQDAGKLIGVGGNATILPEPPKLPEIPKPPEPPKLPDLPKPPKLPHF